VKTTEENSLKAGSTKNQTADPPQNPLVLPWLIWFPAFSALETAKPKFCGFPGIKD
jgi:hypothetical protein